MTICCNTIEKIGGGIILTIYKQGDKEEWNACVKSFVNWDIYYLYEYAYSFMLHGDGDIYLIYFENFNDRFCYVVMKNDIADFGCFSSILDKRQYYDWETPYGYGGPLCDHPISVESEQLFKSEIGQYCRKHNIISQFIRFHPLLKNYEVLPEVIETRYLRDTIFIDTSAIDLIMKNMDSKNRNMVRKAQKSNVEIVKASISEFQDFLSMYNETMERNGAGDYYIFKRDYFEFLSRMEDNVFIFYAMREGRPISGSIMFYNDKYLHYHLSGSFAQYRRYSPGNLLLYDAACWASQKGIKQFHLGGGMAPDDKLFGFKKQFNKNGRVPFVVGRTIFSKAGYDELLKRRKETDPLFDPENSYMIQYRR